MSEYLVDTLLSIVDQEELVRLAKASPIGGCIVEVGVYRGGTAQLLSAVAKERNTTLYLYDTFSGIPFSDKEKGDHHLPGDFGDTDLELVHSRVPDAVICKGVFPDTLTEMPSISFVHCDVDQYQSTKDVIQYLYPKLLQGGMIVIDDYPYLAGAVNAVHEMCEFFKIKLDYTKTGKAILTK